MTKKPDHNRHRAWRHISQILCTKEDMWHWKDAWAAECYLSGRHDLSYSAWVREVLYRETRRMDRRAEIAQSIFADYPVLKLDYGKFVGVVKAQNAAREDLVLGIESMPAKEFAEAAHRPGWEALSHSRRRAEEESE